MSTTIVTSYFKLKQSKATHETYQQWMQNMLVNNNPMVIFCDAESQSMIADFRRGYADKTRIIVTDFKDFYSYRYAKYFLEHYKMDREQRVGHNIFLYMVWSEKSNFLKRAIDMDPFRSDYFIWVDIGCFRVPNTRYLQWPNPEKINGLDKTKVLLLSVVPFTSEELGCRTLEQLPSFQFLNRIGAPILGGGKNALLEWHRKYYEMLEYFITIHRFIGKDQSIMNSVYLLNREMCHLVNWVPGCPNEWFYLQEYLR